MSIDEEEAANATLKYTCFGDISPIIHVLHAKPRLDVLVEREEYVQLRNALECSQATFVTVLGHTGTGKSVFLLYLLLHRLEQRLPTAIQFRTTELYVFEDTQAYMVRPESIEELQLPGFWILVDSNADVVAPSDCLCSCGAARLVHAASPNAKRWEEWTKGEYNIESIVSRLPTLTEIGMIIKVHGLEVARTYDIVNQWGPSIRTIRKLLSGGASAIAMAHSDAIRAARQICENSSVLRSMRLDNDHHAELHSIASSILFIYPIGPCLWAYRVPTSYLSDILDAARQELSTAKAIELFEFFSLHPLTRSASGWRFEKEMHAYLCSGSEPLRLVRGEHKSTMTPSTTLLIGTANRLNNVKGASSSSFYWFPSVTTFPGVDGVLVDDHNVYVVQATMAADQELPAKGLKKIWAAFDANIKYKRTWHYVVVTDRTKGATQHASDLLRTMENFTLGPKGNCVVLKCWSCVLSPAEL
ncbi:uncharacterized protein B0H18DRAFT_880418 [Fomitopsis serialis]|uniref:uncharacterized protein n=1 Tax=Fomitopsis serialis TaxID=139415 RepID=UPI002007DC0A|nr:uncharacterized protein B0H18DRAFT_880418 [Neoantrodia serialis]KAH9921157.1 hypothetical protein B0H18DRAFT_880418 [Neoantrodia serialis]